MLSDGIFGDLKLADKMLHTVNLFHKIVLLSSGGAIDLDKAQLYVYENLPKYTT